MAETEVGRVAMLWRYPVKSMLGEVLERVTLSNVGVCGDRAYALWDHATGRVASAKNPRVWSSLLGYRARFLEPPLPENRSAPEVAIEAAGPETAARLEGPLLSSDPRRDEKLSQMLGRAVSLLDVPPEGASLDQYWPNVKERDFQDVVNELVLPSGTFFDSCPIHAISTSTLERLRQLEPQLDFAVERFRPNLLIQTASGVEGFPEESWIGRTLRLGESLELRVDDGCPRCVVTTLGQGGLPQEIEILRATARHNKVVAGIRLSVLRPGSLEVGDPISLVE